MDRYNIAASLDEAAKKHPYQAAIYFPVGRAKDGRAKYSALSFKQLSELSDQYAHGFADYGIKRGGRTLVMIPPSIDFIAVTFALLKIGAVPILIDPGMGRKAFLQCVAETEPVNMIGIPAAHILSFFIRKPFVRLRKQITVGRKLFWPGKELRELKSEKRTKFCLADTFVADEAAVAFTSGSTGIPKGVVYQQGMFRAQVDLLRNEIGIKAGDIDLPGLYIFALFNPALGVTTVMPDMDASNPAQLNPAFLVEAIETFGVTHSVGSPTIWKIIAKYCEENQLELNSMRKILMMGAPVPPSLIRRYEKLMPKGKVFTPFGATEALPLTLIDGKEILAETADLSEKGAGMCVGKPLSGIDIRVIKISDHPLAEWEDSLELPQGLMGEIAVKGPVVTREYLHRPVQTAEAKIREGDEIWHRLGDVGYFDQAGRLWFCGRKAHIVETDSGILYPVQVEALFNQIPDVARTALVGREQSGRKTAVLVIEAQKRINRDTRKRITKKAFEIIENNGLSKSIREVLFLSEFPVDTRHNAKIKREVIADWVNGCCSFGSLMAGAWLARKHTKRG
jgi:acyl-CoA synthetase (AMP-forming)/AMP-acid ligase II